MDDFLYEGIQFGGFSGSAVFTDGDVDWSAEETSVGRWSLAGRHQLTAPYTGSWDIEWQDAAMVLIDSPDARALLITSGSFQSRGPATDYLQWEGSGEIDTIEARIGSKRLQAKAPVRLSLLGSALEIDGLVVEDPLTSFHATARLSLSEETILLKTAGHLDLSLPARIYPEVRASGELSFDVEAGGAWANPSWSGSFQLKDGRARILGFPHRIDSVEADAELKGQRLTSLQWDGSLGGGEVSGGGTVDWSDGLRYALSFRAQQSRIAWPEGFLGLVDVDARLGGTSGDGLLSGTVTVQRGEYREEFRLTDWLGLGTREYTGDAPSTLPDWIRLDLAVLGEEDVWFRNDAADLETRIDLQLGGTLLRPEYSGRILLYEGGRLRFRDVEYRIVSASLDFLGTESLDPYVNLVAESSIDRYLVRLTIDGSLDQFDYQLTSTPTLTQSDIIALLTTGSTLENQATTGAASSVFRSDLAANYFAGALTDPFERQLRRITGFERVRIDPLLSGTNTSADPTARITLGKEVAKDLLLLYTTELDSTEANSYRAEWQASRKFRFVAEQDTDGVLGADFLYVDRFRGPGAERKSVDPLVESPPAQRSPPLLIDSISVGGVSEELQSDLLAACGLERGQSARRSEVFDAREKILTELVRRGNLSAEVQVDRVLSGAGSLSLRFRVDPGAITDLQVQNVSGRQAKQLLRQAKEAWRQAIHREDAVLEAEDAMRVWLQARGYYTADVYGEASRSENREVVVFTVDKGKKIRVDDVRIEGANNISESRIRKQLLTRRGNLFGSGILVPEVLAEDLRAIENLYRDQGFLNVRIPAPRIRLSTDGQRAGVTVNIEEGVSFVVRGVSLTEQNAIPDEEILQAAAVELDEPFSPSRLVVGTTAIRNLFDSRGYPESRVRTRLTRGVDYVLVHFEITVGPRVIFDSLNIASEGKTNPSLIRREITLNPGDPVSRAGIQDIRHRLYRLGVFSSVSVEYAPVEDGTDRHLLNIRTEDSKPIALTLGAGYDTEGDVRGSFTIAHDNLFGSGLAVGLQTRASGRERLFQVTTSKARLFDSNWDGLFNVGFERLEEIGYSQESRFGGLRFEIPRGDRLRTFLRFSFQNVDLLDIVDPLAVREEKLEDIQLADLGYSFVRDHRDDPFSPTLGTLISGDAQVFTSILGSEAEFLKITGTLSTIYPFTDRQRWASGVRFGISLPYGVTNAVPLPERFFAGGESTIRGFSRDAVGPSAGGVPSGGEVIWIINEEYRFPIWASLRGVLFYDAGNVYESASEFDLSELRHSVGGGLRLQTPIGPLRLEYGHKLRRRTGESSGELFFSIGVPF
jgi:outer membrane protein assembly complex protein YaeT